MSETEIGAGTIYIATIALGAGDAQFIFAGGEVDGQIINSGGQQYNYGSVFASVIFANGSLDNNSLGSNITIAGGELQNYGTLFNTSVESGGQLVILGEGPQATGTAFASEVFSGGVVLDNGIDSGGTILAGGLELVGSGAVALNMDVQAGGYLVALPGSTVSATGQVVSSGELLLGPGSLITLDPAGSLIITAGQQDLVLGSVTTTGEQILSGGTLALYGGQTGNVTIGNGGQQVLYGGMALNPLVLSGGLQVLSGGTAFDALVLSGGQQALYAGTASGTTIANGGYGAVNQIGTGASWLVENGGTANFIEGFGQNILVQSGGTLGDFSGTLVATTLQAGATLASYDGYTSQTQIEYGAVENFNAGTATGAVIAGGGLEILANATAVGAIIAQGGVQLLMGGAVASGTTLQAGAVQIVLPGATVTGNTGPGYSINHGAVAVQGTQAPVLNPTTPALLSGLGAYEFVLSGGSVSNATLTQGAGQYLYGGVVSGTTLEAGGAQYLEGGIAYDTLIDLGGSVTIGNYATGGLAVDNTINGGTLLLNTDGTLGGTLYFAGADSTFATDQVLFGTVLSLPVMSGFAAGDVLDFTQMEFQTGVSSLSVAGDVLTINGAYGEQVLLTLSGDAGANFLLDANAHGATELTIEAPLCFLAGTRIAVPGGETPVEALRAGDMVMSAHAGPVALRWVGRRSYGGPFLAANPACQPVRIAANALAGGLPARDLFVSPGHGLFVDGLLIPAGLLVNGASITRAALAQVDYYHLDVGTQEVLLAEACQAESFAGEALRGRFQNAAEYAALYPEAPAVELWLAHTTQGPGLEAVRARLAARAGLAASGEPAGRLRGYVDVCRADHVAGWAQWEGAPELPVWLDIWRGETRLARVLANFARDDLRAAGLGSGRHGFSLDIAPGEGVLRICAVRNGAEIALTEAARAA